MASIASPSNVAQVTRKSSPPAQDPSPGRGRPKLHTDEQILDAALRMFATHGYDGMSLRSLNRELGLSHSAIHQRFGTKEDLYKAVIDHAFGGMFSEIREHILASPRPTEPLAQLQQQLKAFLIVSSRHPYLNRLMNNEGLEDSWHLDHIYSHYIQSAMQPIRRIMEDQIKKKVLKPTPIRTVFFLAAHGAAAIFTLRALSAKFSPQDGKVDVERTADDTAWQIVNGLRR